MDQSAAIGARPAVKVALVDVGGTLWPNTWLVVEADQRVRIEAVTAALGPRVAREQVEPLILAVSERVEEGQGLALRRQADEIIAEVLAEYQLPHHAVDAARVRRAMCVVLGCRIAPFAGATELLAGIRGLGLHCIIVSNTTFRDRHAYQRDFDLLGWTRWIDHIVTSIDVGHFKPARQMFDASLQAARCQPSECVMVGDSETADIEPASALGMRTLRVTIEHPLPKASCADAVVDSLGVVLSVLTNWAISSQ